MGCSPSSSAGPEDQHHEQTKNMLIQDFKNRADPWKFSFEASVEYDPWEGNVEKSSSSIESKAVRILTPRGSTGEDVSIIDLRRRSGVIKAALNCDNVFKNSECQTDQPEGVDFDWDLSDKIDTETQTSPPTPADWGHSEPLDVIVQTDQRIVFSTNKKRVSLEESDKTVKASTSSQTSWDVTDQEIQVDQTYFGNDQWDPSEKTLTSSLENSWGDKEDQLNESTKDSSQILTFSSQSHARFTLDDDIDEPLAFVHKSSIALAKNRKITKEDRYKNKGIQITESSLLYDSEFPPETKVDFLGDDPLFFTEVDDHVQTVSRKLVKHLTSIVDIVRSYQERRDLVSVRAIFVWICENISYDPAYRNTPLSTIDILRLKTGVCREFVKIFQEMCQIANVEVQTIEGFIKTHNYTPGDKLKPESDSHSWNAVLLEGNWRLIDVTRAAGDYDSLTGEWKKRICEHFFLTDPEELIYTHFPLLEGEAQYDKWQLLTPSLTMHQFISFPHFSAEFFQNGLELETNVGTPWTIQDKGTLVICSWEVMRYKHMLFEAGEAESQSHNKHCFSYLHEEDRTTASFQIFPPTVGKFVLRIYGVPEAVVSIEEPSSLELLASFLIKCNRVSPKVPSWPVSDIPWGLTGDFHSLGLRMVIDNPAKWEGCKILLKVGAKAMFKFVHRQWPIMSSVSLYDNQGNQLVQEKESLFFLSSSVSKDNLKSSLDNGKVKAFVSKKTGKAETIFTVFAPPSLGYYKLVVHAARIPRSKERVFMPVVATFLVEMRELPARSKSRGKLESSLKLSSISEVASDSGMYMNTTVNSQSSFLSDLLGKSKNEIK